MEKACQRQLVLLNYYCGVPAWTVCFPRLGPMGLGESDTVMRVGTRGEGRGTAKETYKEVDPPKLFVFHHIALNFSSFTTSL